MARPEKVAVVEEIKEKLESSRGVFLTEYRGLTVGQQQELRRSLRKANAEYRVLKMSLARLAAESAGFTDLLVWLEGPTAIAFTEGDPVPAAKSLKEFSDSNNLLVLKGGLLAGETLDIDSVLRLAELEPRDVLLAKLAGAMAAPMSKLVGLMSAVLRQPATAMQHLLEKKQAEPGATPEAAAETEESAAEELADDDAADKPATDEADAQADDEEPPEAADAAEAPDESAPAEPVAKEPAEANAEADGEPAAEVAVEDAAASAAEDPADDDSKDSE